MERKVFLIAFMILLSIGCSDHDEVIQDNNCFDSTFFTEYTAKNFKMGFSTWIYAPNLTAANNTYQFISDYSDIYTEHIDNNIPWDAWINDKTLPTEFTDDINNRVNRRIQSNSLLLSISLLNIDRSDLAEDFNGSIPLYEKLNDKIIEDAYFKHVDYLVQQLQPDYLVIAIEVNELRIKSESRWEEYKLLIHEVIARIRNKYSSLQISESITLHNLFQPEVDNPKEYINEMVTYANKMEFVAISYYPFFKGQHTKTEFQIAFDFLHREIKKPIAFSETGHIAENLGVPSFNFFAEGSVCEQNAYMETLLKNAQDNNYKFVIWWTHRDFDELWETFPEELKDLGKLWRDTGLLDENGGERLAFQTWKKVLIKK